MFSFVIPVRNDSTGEIRHVSITTAGAADAQIMALHHVFKAEGWRKATALHPSGAAVPRAG